MNNNNGFNSNNMRIAINKSLETLAGNEFRRSERNGLRISPGIRKKIINHGRRMAGITINKLGRIKNLTISAYNKSVKKVKDSYQLYIKNNLYALKRGVLFSIQSLNEENASIMAILQSVVIYTYLRRKAGKYIDIDMDNIIYETVKIILEQLDKCTININVTQRVYFAVGAVYAIHAAAAYITATIFFRSKIGTIITSTLYNVNSHFIKKIKSVARKISLKDIIKYTEIDNNTQFINNSIMSVNLKNIKPNNRYFILNPQKTNNKIKYVYDKNALKKLNEMARKNGKNTTCPFTFTKFNINNKNQIINLQKNKILEHYKKRLVKSHNFRRDVESLKRNKPNNITNNDINKIVKKIKRH